MKRKTSLLIAGMVLMVLMGQSLVVQRSYAGFDCEIDRFNDFMEANSTYTTALHSWYFENPISCYTECENQCAQMPPGPARDQCVASIPSCEATCDSNRFDAFTSAGNAMVAAGNQPCTYNPDYCDNARYLNDQCIATYQAQMANPVLDENNEIDGVWWSAVVEERFACVAASGIDACR